MAGGRGSSSALSYALLLLLTCSGLDGRQVVEDGHSVCEDPGSLDFEI